MQMWLTLVALVSIWAVNKQQSFASLATNLKSDVHNDPNTKVKTTNMASTSLAAFVICGIEAIFGIVSNSFIIAVSFWDKTEGFTLSPVSLIHIHMGLTNVIMLIIMTTAVATFTLSSQTIVPKEFYLVIIVSMFFLVTFGFWLTSWLCIYYCLTIVDFKHNVIRRLKMNLSTVVPKILVGTALGSFIISVPTIWYVKLCSFSAMYGNLTTDCTADSEEVFHFNHFYIIIFITTGCFFPLSLSITSISFTLASILGHIWKIRLNTITLSSSSNQLVAHYRACRTMILLVVLYILFNIAEVITASSSMYAVNVWTVIFWYFTYMYPAAQAAILISGSSKLKRNLLRMFFLLVGD
ncbi:taste receptor type 2 member 40-like [Bombina bombina]|uniref:taste receptor type 2 member 40-like n=1 Tax=Bombina bombina TaxID=8345 RepID=UPI00235AB310|nr:taste receptor type 2 member 40-like [Bombina bombina]